MMPLRSLIEILSLTLVDSYSLLYESSYSFLCLRVPMSTISRVHQCPVHGRPTIVIKLMNICVRFYSGPPVKFTSGPVDIRFYKGYPADF